MKGWRILIAVLLCSALIGLSACNMFDGNTSSTGQWLSDVKRGDISISVSGSGNIQVDRDINLAFGTGGKLENLYVEEGDTVKKGDILGKLETDSLELALKQSELNVAQAELAITQAILSESQAEVALSQAVVAQSQARVNVESSRFELDRMKDVEDIQDNIDKIELEIKTAEAKMKVAIDSKAPDVDVTYWGATIGGLKAQLAQYRLDLADLLGKEGYTSLQVDEVKIKYLRLQAAENALEQAGKAVDQAQKALEQSGESIDFSRKSLEVAKLAVNQAKKNVTEATLTAPFDGLVAAVYADEGDIIPAPSVSPRTIIYLIDSSSMELEVDVDEIDIPDVQIGQKAIITLDSFPQKPYEGKVTFISILPTPQSGIVLFKVKIGFQPPADSGIRVNMSADANIILQERTNALLIPSQAIYRDSQGNTVVTVTSNDKTEQKAVVVGLDDGFDVEIVSGLNEGETVVVSARGSQGF